jgi:hypothetical protein
VAATNKDAPLAIVENFGAAIPLGIAVFAATVVGLYVWTRRQAAVAAA